MFYWIESYGISPDYIILQYNAFPLCQKATIHQVTTMLATSENVLFSGHNHLLTTGAEDLTLYLSPSLALDW